MELVLGTTQFGMHYGINNKTGKPKKDEVFQMLDLAAQKGIKTIDTAAIYGDAEEIIGEYLSIRKGQVTFEVFSKLMPNLVDEKAGNSEKIVEEEVQKSLQRLGIDCLSAYFLHTPSNFYDKSVMRGLANCKQRGLVKSFGVSTYEVQDALAAVGSGLVDIISIPYNIFDQRLNNTEFFEIAKANNVKICARSTLLQGLLLMGYQDVPDYLNVAVEYLEKVDGIIKKRGFTRLEAAFYFAYNNPDIDYLIFGVDNINQLEEDLALPRQKVIFTDCYRDLYDQFVSVKQSVVLPSLWAKNYDWNWREE